MSDLKKNIQDVFDCAGENDVGGRMVAGAASGAVLGGYAGAGTPVSTVTSLGFGVLGALIGSLPTLMHCTQQVATDKYPAPVPNVTGPKPATPAR